ncbi:hypothetical protein MKZ38_001868 [Zalerion maritima]|uniref:Uncharacterized protein n=1 Tax=Zalerion maritima TaxID=339359 RepID=A0AAD5WTJ7_9PEZI|nr:hypothetical protein MKZ38_001868 [Zalerion maritima]
MGFSQDAPDPIPVPPGSNHHLNDIISHHRYLPGSNSAPFKKPPYIKKCFCTECHQSGLKGLLRLAQNVAWAGELDPPRNETRKYRFPHHDGIEGQDLAREAGPGEYLPGDFKEGRIAGGQGRFQLRKRPSLSREEAFSDFSTSTKSNSSSRTNSWSGKDDDNSQNGKGRDNGGLTDLEVAELYRLGILYDDEHVRGEGFSLDSIEHREPQFSLRPAKRQRRSARRNPTKKHGKSNSIASSTSSAFEMISPSMGPSPLPLDLSFADLGSDETIANYLISNPDFEFPGFDHIIESESDFLGQHSRNMSSVSRSAVPVTVIYEVDESEEKVVPSVEELPELTHDEDSQSTQDSSFPSTQQDDNGLYDTDSDHSDEEGTEEEDWEDIRPESAISPPPQGDGQDAWIVLGDDS